MQGIGFVDGIPETDVERIVQTARTRLAAVPAFDIELGSGPPVLDPEAILFPLYLGHEDVPDPMGRGEEAFRECAVLIEAGTALHLGNRP
ncbi:hypothetical protein [Streptomyces sp. NBC_00237]|uniref:hypothetical protein n=1 Tax=Streptomyces sp. NBC_00237 TaxID=2975687 RepID=UPI002B1DEF64|nr:hypothetical protein [Streptomyces sp. NBC_00237]